jgi:hypothetical protein
MKFRLFANCRKLAQKIARTRFEGEGRVVKSEQMPYVRPEPFSPQFTPEDAQHYFTAIELARHLDSALERETEATRRRYGDIDGRRCGRPGQSRRALLLARAVLYAKRLTRSLAPLAGIEA